MFSCYPLLQQKQRLHICVNPNLCRQCHCDYSIDSYAIQRRCFKCICGIALGADYDFARWVELAEDRVRWQTLYFFNLKTFQRLDFVASSGKNYSELFLSLIQILQIIERGIANLLLFFTPNCPHLSLNSCSKCERMCCHKPFFIFAAVSPALFINRLPSDGNEAYMDSFLY